MSLIPQQHVLWISRTAQPTHCRALIDHSPANLTSRKSLAKQTGFLEDAEQMIEELGLNRSSSESETESESDTASESDDDDDDDEDDDDDDDADSSTSSRGSSSTPSQFSSSSADEADDDEQPGESDTLVRVWKKKTQLTHVDDPTNVKVSL